MHNQIKIKGINIILNLEIYGIRVAGLIGQAGAFRAVAGAVSVNPVAYLIPCHRVIAKSGKIHGCRWGEARKKAIIGWEAPKRARS